jgi:hypothetical protein
MVHAVEAQAIHASILGSAIAVRSMAGAVPMPIIVQVDANRASETVKGDNEVNKRTSISWRTLVRLR